MSDRGVAVVIAAYNEEERLEETLRAARKIPGVTRLVVVDDGSRDHTTEVALAAGADRVITFPHNQGKGRALQSGLSEVNEPLVLLLDADLGSSALSAAALLGPVQAGEADMSIAVLPHTARGGGMGLAVKLARWGIENASGRRFQAPLSGQRCVTRTLLERVGTIESRFGVETALTIDALRAGFRVCEIDAPIRHRVTGRSVRGIMHRARQFRDIASALMRGGRLRRNKSRSSDRVSAASPRE